MKTAGEFVLDLEPGKGEREKKSIMEAMKGFKWFRRELVNLNKASSTLISIGGKLIDRQVEKIFAMAEGQHNGQSITE